MTTNRIATIAALTCSLLTGSAALATAQEAAATVGWGAAKVATTQPKTVTLEMSPLGTVPVPTTEGDGIHTAYYAGYVGSQAFDFASTSLALGKGAFEHNPVMSFVGASGPGGLLVKAVTSWGVAQIVKKISRRNSKLAAVTMTTLTAMNTAASVNNLANAAALR
ncbi:MAG: hypothetical protein QF681_10040 [Vicinamibacterales bacterium]|jgi:hypothetical protein|nr:hypothetical protein [Vicinamibacterales bacterium]